MELLILLNKFALLGSSGIELLHIYQALHNLWELLSPSILVLCRAPPVRLRGPHTLPGTYNSSKRTSKERRSLSLDGVSRSHEHEGS